MRLLVLLLLVASPALAAPETSNVPRNIGPFGAAASYELTNIFSLQSTFGPTYRRDIETTTNSGAIALDGGYIEVKTGTTTGSTAQLDTVERGQYQPGKGAEAGLAVNVVTPPTGDGVAEWGLGDGDNGAFWRLKGDGSVCVVYERATTEQEFCGSDLNGYRADEISPASEAYIYVVRFNWYGVGGAQFVAYATHEGYAGTLRPLVAHTFAPENGLAMEDPNLPIFASVDNGATTTDVEIEVGGRRYDIQGKFKPETRISGEYRIGQTVTASGDPVTPLVCMRREDPFPEAGRQNAVNVYIEGFGIETDEDLIVWFASVDDLADLTGESFGTPSQHSDGETAVESDKNSTAIANVEAVDGPWLRAGGDTGNRSRLTSEKGRRIPFVSTNPTCLVAIVPGGTDATVDSTVRVVEEW